MTNVLGQIKAAWNPSDPMALHHAVERMAFEGATRQELESALSSLLLEIRANGADDETEEIVNGVADRITGWCMLAHHIKTREATTTNGAHSKPIVGTST